MELNGEQKKLVEDNHSLIYWYAGKYHIPIDEYYDILATALCKAAYYYDPNKGAFSTCATTFMRNELLMLNRRENQLKSCIPKDNIVHFDKDNTWEYSSELPKYESLEDDILDKEYYKQVVEKISSLLRDKDREIFEYLLQGLTMRDIANIKGVSHQCIHSKIKRIREIVLRRKLLEV